MNGGHFLLSDGYYLAGLLARGVALLLSCLGVFLAVRCSSVARACEGADRVRWLLLGGVAAGVIAAWAADFIGLLGMSVPGHALRYSVPVTLGCIAAAACFLSAGMLATGLRPAGRAGLVASGVIAGLGVAFMHYLGVAAMRVPARVSYSPALLAVSVALAAITATAVLWAASALRSVRSAIGAAVVIGVLISGMRDAGTAAVRLAPAASPAGMIVGGGRGATAASLLLPFIIGLAITVFLICWAVALAPTEESMRYDKSLLDRIRRRARTPLTDMPLPAQPLATPAPAAGDARPAVRSSPPWTFAELRRPRSPGGPGKTGEPGRRSGSDAAEPVPPRPRPARAEGPAGAASPSRAAPPGQRYAAAGQAPLPRRRPASPA